MDTGRSSPSEAPNSIAARGIAGTEQLSSDWTIVAPPALPHPDHRSALTGDLARRLLRFRRVIRLLLILATTGCTSSTFFATQSAPDRVTPSKNGPGDACFRAIDELGMPWCLEFASVDDIRPIRVEHPHHPRMAQMRLRVEHEDYFGWANAIEIRAVVRPRRLGFSRYRDATGAR